MKSWIASSPRCARIPRNDGFSLMEAIFSMLLLSFMVLSLETLQISALRAAKTDYYFAAAMQQILNGMKSPPGDWQKQNEIMLPMGNGQKTENKITIKWGEGKAACVNDKLGLSGCVGLNL